MTGPLRFSIIMPTHRRPRSLQRVLDALRGQDYPPDSFEVIVIVDGDDSGVSREPAARDYPFRVRTIHAQGGGPASARNRGLAEAGEPYVLFLDDDVVPAPALLAQHAASHRAPDVVVIGPLLAARSARPAPWTRWEWATLADQYHAMETGRWATTPRQFYTGNASVRLDHVKAVGGFNPEFRRGEDVELAWRLHQRGLRFVFNPHAAAEHLADRSYDAWLRAAHEYGRTDVMLERIRTGADLPDWVRREFQTRHRYTQLLARAVVSRPRMWGPIPACGRIALEVADHLGLSRAARHACSALFTAAYWRGVSEQIGRAEALALTREAPPTASAEQVA